MTKRTLIIAKRVAPALMEMIKCAIELSDATKPKRICGGGLKKIATSTTTI